MIRQYGRALLLLLASSWAACASPPDVIGSIEQPIVNGTFEPGHPEVVFVYNLRGAACTGTVISPYVVLTANHCVEVSDGVPGAPSGFRVYVGSSTRALTAEYTIAQVRPVPNAGLNGREANDVALLVLATPAAEAPMGLYRGPASNLWGMTVTSIGYGQTPTGASGTKYRTSELADGYDSGFVFVQPSVCPGDSGGPLVAPDGTVAGVASFIFSPDGRSQPTCGTAPGAYNEIYRHLDFIDMVLEETGTCIPAGNEACNGLDDNCDGQIDEGCIAIGSACSTSEECVGGLCADTPVGRLCTVECDAQRPAQGCAPGFYCGSNGCNGYCVPGAAGTALVGEGCAADTDCFSLFCRNPGDGVQRCLEPCRQDAGECLGGEVCAALAGGCGSCVEQALFGARGLGEPCEADAECGDGRVCFERAGVRECAGACAADGTCPDLFACRDGLCVRDRTQGPGGVCLDSSDCGDAVCASLGERAWCTVDCTSNDDCPTGFACTAAGASSVCAPATLLDGESCTTSGECASGVCAMTGAASFCTRACDAENACGPGLICQRTGTASPAAVCVPPPEPVDEGGCSAAPSGLRGVPLVLALGALGAFVLRRRRAL
ncbi:MAG: trypsin-like serine protease [Sandaracinaceae bacterium]